MTTIDGYKGVDKMCTFVVDPENNAFTFFKYKGELIDLNEYGLKEHLNQVIHFMIYIGKYFFFKVPRSES